MALERDSATLRHDYRVLDVPWDASPRAIKASYRKLIKRWHPDRYRPESDAYSDSSLMTKLINQSYARIKNAPLQDRAADPFSFDASPDADTWEDSKASGEWRSEYSQRNPGQDAAEFHRVLEKARRAGALDDALRPFDWFGFWVRFVCGAIFGAALGFGGMAKFSLFQEGTGNQEQPGLIYMAFGLTVVICALASGLGGDKFWRSIRPGGVWWWHRWD